MYASSKLSLPQDAHLISSLIGSKIAYSGIEKSDTINVTHRFDGSYRKYPDREALVFEGRSYTYRDINLGKHSSHCFSITRHCVYWH